MSWSLASSEASILSDALPFMRSYRDSVLVIKCGGNALRSLSSFARDVVQLKQVGMHPIVVHGGGPQIDEFSSRLGFSVERRRGNRVTDSSAIEIVEMVLRGMISPRLVSAIGSAGGFALGMSGKDAAMMTVRRLGFFEGFDLGYVGVPERVDGSFLSDAIRFRRMIPVLSPLACGSDGATYNVNADVFAGAIASAVGAKRLLLLTDVDGLRDVSGTLISELSVSSARGMIDRGEAVGGMIPKLETCIDAIESGVEGAVILDGRVSHILLLEILTSRGMGTRVTLSGAS